jgi:hypothetical protein
MHFILRVILCFVVITLVGCASYQASLVSATTKATCKNTCQQRFKSCKQACHNNCQGCKQSSNRSVIHHFNKYKHEQCVQGGMIIRDLNSYRDPLQCKKITCDCLADYNVCTQSCSGIIHKSLQIAPVCC